MFEPLEFIEQLREKNMSFAKQPCYKDNAKSNRKLLKQIGRDLVFVAKFWRNDDDNQRTTECIGNIADTLVKLTDGLIAYQRAQIGENENAVIK